MPVGHPRFGRAAPCTCRLEELQAAQAEHLRSLSTLGALGAKRFDNFLPEGHTLEPEQRRSLRRAYDTCYAFAENPRGWLLLHGGYGCGKTHLAAAIANYRLAHGQVVIFVNTPDLLDHLRSTFSPASEVEYDDLFDQVRHAPLLILDDLGAESATTWAKEKLFQLIDHRYTANLPTVLTTADTPDDLNPRLATRLLDPAHSVVKPITAPAYRGGKKARAGRGKKRG